MSKSLNIRLTRAKPNTARKRHECLYNDLVRIAEGLNATGSGHFHQYLKVLDLTGLLTGEKLGDRDIEVATFYDISSTRREYARSERRYTFTVQGKAMITTRAGEHLRTQDAGSTRAGLEDLMRYLHAEFIKMRNETVAKAMSIEDLTRSLGQLPE